MGHHGHFGTTLPHLSDVETIVYYRVHESQKSVQHLSPFLKHPLIQIIRTSSFMNVFPFLLSILILILKTMTVVLFSFPTWLNFLELNPTFINKIHQGTGVQRFYLAINVLCLPYYPNVCGVNSLYHSKLLELVL